MSPRTTSTMPRKDTAWIIKPEAKPFEFFDADGASAFLSSSIQKPGKKPYNYILKVLFHATYSTMVLHHTDENLKSPPVPFDLLKIVHISLAEGMEMGVSSESMMKYRT